MACQLVSLGRTLVMVAGTPQRVVAPVSLNPATVHAVVIQVLPSNTGKVYVGVSGLNKTTLAGVLSVLAVPTANMLPAFSISITHAANAIPVTDLYIDVDTGGEGVLISALVA